MNTSTPHALIQAGLRRLRDVLPADVQDRCGMCTAGHTHATHNGSTEVCVVKSHDTVHANL